MRVALTIAGSDPSGGAGIQADLKTFTAFGVYGASVVTALTVQDTRGVRSILEIAPELVADQLDVVVEDLAPAAAKTGCCAAGVIEMLVRAFGSAIRALVFDPVMMSTVAPR